MIIVNSGMNLSQNDHDNTVPIVGSRLDDAIGIVLKAEEEGQSTELADWLGLHPELAGELARVAEDGCAAARLADNPSAVKEQGSAHTVQGLLEGIEGYDGAA